MRELDIKYMAGLVESAKSGNNDAFTELFTATYQKQYKYIYSQLKDFSSALNAMQHVYIYAWKHLGELDSPDSFVFWLERISYRTCQNQSLPVLPPLADLPKDMDTNTESKSAALDIEVANQLLLAVFIACDTNPGIIPVKMLESWGNYQKSRFRIGRLICTIFLLALLLLPLMFLQPKINAQRTNIDTQFALDTKTAGSASYAVEVKNLLPIADVSATLDGAPLEITKTDSKHYTVTVTSNGTLAVAVTSLNGQTASKTYDISLIDSEKPKLVSSYTDGGKLYLIVLDTYSGIDYDNIFAYNEENAEVLPDYLDKDNAIICFTIPTEKVYVTIPDHAGNELYLTLTPD